MKSNSKFLTLVIAVIVVIYNAIASIFAYTHHPDTKYRTIAFTQNELIIAQEETIEELATIIQISLPAYRPDYSTIDSLNYILDSLYTHPK